MSIRPMSYIPSRYAYARGVGVNRREAMRFALDIGHNAILAEATQYVGH